MKLEQILMTKKELAYRIIDHIDSGVDYNEILKICLQSFPNLSLENKGDQTLRQILLDEVVNKNG